MYMVVSPPAVVFGISLLWGAGLGMLWDLFRIFRLSFPTGKTVAFIEDVVYAILASFATLLFFYLFTSGGFRLFVFIGELLGFVVYYFTIGRLVYQIFIVVIRLIKKLIGWITWPLRKLIRFAARKLAPVLKKARRSQKKFSKKFKNSLPFWSGSLYNNHRMKKPGDSVHDRQSVGLANTSDHRKPRVQTKTNHKRVKQRRKRTCLKWRKRKKENIS